jgi:hypothetical protein
VNQPTPSLHKEYTLTVEEPAEDDRELVDDEEEALTEEVDNITETIPLGFAPMLRYKKRGLNPPSTNTIVEDEDDSSSE